MVGKIKHVRQKLHQEAVKFDRPGDPGSPGCTSLPLGSAKPLCSSERDATRSPTRVEKNVTQVLAERSLPAAGIFAGTKISPEALVQTLKFEEPPDVPMPARTCETSKAPEDKKIKSKKEKMKERRERWLSKISSIKQAKEQQAAEARRQATPVVGDMRPLADALPTLCQLIGPTTAVTTSRRKSRKNKAPMKRPEPTDFNQMKQSQKRKLLETETNQFNDAVKKLSGKMNPLADIGELLRKRMKKEEDGCS